jgi:hypothetical protein
LADFSVVYEHQFKEWQSRSNYLCCLETSRCKMLDLIDYLSLLKIKYNIFVEPDIGNDMTALAVESLSQEVHKKIFNKFKLTLS